MAYIAANRVKVVYSYTGNDGSQIYESVVSHTVSTLVDDKFQDFILVKQSDVRRIEYGQTITYTLILQNLSACDIYNIVLTDRLSENIEFIPQSVIVFDQRWSDCDITDGISFRCLHAHSFIRVQFTARHKQMSGDCTAENTAFASFEYSENENKTKIFNLASNMNKVTVSKKYLQTDLVTQIKAEENQPRRTVTVSGRLINISAVDINNIKLEISTYPQRTFTVDSIIADGVSVNPESLVIMESIEKSEEKSIIVKLIFDSPFYCITDLSFKFSYEYEKQ